MPASKKVKLSLADLVEMRRAIPPVPKSNGQASLSERFVLPPFSVLDARQGYWQNRKRMWLAMGVDPTLGRGDNLLDFSNSVRLGTRYQRRLATSINIKSWIDEKVENGELNAPSQTGTSSFDPVLCELVYRWFTPPKGSVLDPCVGGPMAGIVACTIGRSYTGIDIRPEQIEANRLQSITICPNGNFNWIVGDATNATTLCANQQYDLLYSCPPYADLEIYSDNPCDLSTMNYDKFLVAYTRMIEESCSLLRDDRFAVFVVGDIRDKETGYYRNFVSETIQAFHSAGLELYNDMVLITAIGSLPLRISKQFVGYRKVGKAHQNVLVFLKGDVGKAVKACGPVDVEDVEMPQRCVNGAIAMCDYGNNSAYLRGEPQIEAALLCDIIRGEARAFGVPVPRVWVGRNTTWERVDDNADLSYVIGDKAYLNRALFPNAQSPGAAPPIPQKLRGVK